jgi:hypothetical protein
MMACEHRPPSEWYVKTMEKVLEKGPGFINDEQKRLEKVKKSKVSSDKKREFTVRLNVLTAFL